LEKLENSLICGFPLNSKFLIWDHFDLEARVDWIYRLFGEVEAKDGWRRVEAASIDCRFDFPSTSRSRRWKSNWAGINAVSKLKILHLHIRIKLNQNKILHAEVSKLLDRLLDVSLHWKPAFCFCIFSTLKSIPSKQLRYHRLSPLKGMHRCAWKGSIEAALLLIESGADIKVAKIPLGSCSDVNEVTNEGEFLFTKQLNRINFTTNLKERQWWKLNAVCIPKSS
jgi:hypothetical protein